MTNWLEKIKEERERQLKLGFTAEHDDLHISGQIADHASTLATTWLSCVDIMYPYSETAIKDGIKDGDRKIQLIKAGALIIAELERLERVDENRNINMLKDAICREARKLDAVGFSSDGRGIKIKWK